MDKPRLMRRLLRRQRWRCYYCNDLILIDLAETHPQRATLDHQMPLSRGGTNKRINLVAACNECNQLKGDMTASEFLQVHLC